jgi:hypothetical protein
MKGFRIYKIHRKSDREHLLEVSIRDMLQPGISRRGQIPSKPRGWIPPSIGTGLEEQLLEEKNLLQILPRPVIL